MSRGEAVVVGFVEVDKNAGDVSRFQSVVMLFHVVEDCFDSGIEVAVVVLQIGNKLGGDCFL